jgi:hypothetical protein
MRRAPDRRPGDKEPFVKRWVLAVVMAVGVAVAPATSADTPAPVIKVLSNVRADLVSDGQALVGIEGPHSTKGLSVTSNGRDVSRAFAVRESGGLEGIVDKLRVGTNVITVKAPGMRAARLVITNHPNGGPIFGGPQIQPWRCRQGSRDAQCNQPAQYTYSYKSTDPRQAGLKFYDPKNPATDVATVQTEGGPAPFIVRQELGYIARDEYKILTLIDPKKPWDRWSPPKTFNHKLLVTGGGGCGGSYGTGGAPLEDFSGTIPNIPGRDNSYVDALGMGYVVMSTALANTGHNCNVATEAEALIMLKERVIERYGDVRFTIGTGCSGGSIVQHTVANAYPGAVYDGLIVTCAYPDTFSAGAQFADYHMLRHYFENPDQWGPGVVWTPAQWAAVEGRPDPVNAVVADEGLFKDAVQPVGDCVPEGQRYDPVKKPGGVRCSILDYMKVLMGPRPKSVWTTQEKKAGFGFAGTPFSNRGIQYGLGALQAGLITPEMFVDLNEKIGGLDIDAQPSPNRLEGDDLAVANSYRTGMMDLTDNLDKVAIIDHAGPDPGAAHDYAHTWWVRDRLDARHGTHENQVLWFGPTPLVGDVTWPTQAIKDMSDWLAAVKADTSRWPLAKKIIFNRPIDVHDRCSYVPLGVRVRPIEHVCLPEFAHTRFGSPREVAGGSRLNDVLKCQLKPLVNSGYGVLGLSADQFARLKKVFPRGVCDWSKRGVGEQPVRPWQTYADSKGNIVYGGKAMPPAPRSSAF